MIAIAERADAGYGPAPRTLEIDGTSLAGSVFLTLGDSCIELHREALLAAIDVEVSSDTGALDLRELLGT